VKKLNKNYLKTLAFFALLIITLGCSTKKNRFFNRGYHAMTTNYNILFNGENAFQKGLSEINDKYLDNYWEEIPIEPLEFEDNEELFEIPVYKRGGEEKTDQKLSDKKESFFDIAEEKAVKAVQKHSMNIDGVERNPKIDDAFLLLGKARYYSQRFVPALEAFNYVIRNYPKANVVDETIVWKAKTNIRLQNEEIAIISLEYLLERKEISDAILEDAHTTMAIAYRQQDSISLVIGHLEKAITYSQDPQKKARNLFVLGQLHRKQNNINQSQQAFQQLIEFKKAPKNYRLYAEIEKAKNYQKGKDVSSLIEKFQNLIQDRDNRPYLDVLYYQLAVMEGNRGNREGLIENYIKSIHAKDAKDFQKGLSFEGLGDLYFEEANYPKAGAYYDSVLQVSGVLNTSRIRKLKIKRKSLETVIALEDNLKRNDSLWKLISMDSLEQQQYFQGYIQSLKEKEAKVKEAEEFQKKLAKYENFGMANTSQTPLNNNKGKWYFYNIQTLGFGLQEFKRVWGNRALKDNWRWSEAFTLPSDEIGGELEDIKNVNEAQIPENHKVSYYLGRLPSTEREMDSISELRESAYYQLGLIYKEQFKELELAAEKLERFLVMYQGDKLLLGTNYHLYKIYDELNDSKAAIYKNVILKDFPASVFSQMILTPNDFVETNQKESKAENRYKEIYLNYKSGAYAQTIKDILATLPIFEGSMIVPKLELLKVFAIAKIEGKEAYKKALNHLVLTYADTAEGEKAKELLIKIK